MPPVSAPVIRSFFALPVESAECMPVDSTVYSSLLGKLVQFLKTRFDVKPFVSELCSHNHAPLEYHYRQAIHILRYLVSSPGIGPLFKTDSGVVLPLACYLVVVALVPRCLPLVRATLLLLSLRKLFPLSLSFP